jgi:hypothetical protein
MTALDFFAALRQAESRTKASAMDRVAKAAYLRGKGWRRVSTSGSQRWQDRNDGSYTLTGATVEQLTRELRTDR